MASSKHIKSFFYHVKLWLAASQCLQSDHKHEKPQMPNGHTNSTNIECGRVMRQNICDKRFAAMVAEIIMGLVKRIVYLYSFATKKRGNQVGFGLHVELFEFSISSEYRIWFFLFAINWIGLLAVHQETFSCVPFFFA